MFSRFLAAVAVCFLLSGCSLGSSSTPVPLPAPPPGVELALPTRRIYQADFSQASIGLTGFLEEGTPPQDMGGAPDAVWCTFPRPGLGGLACVDPAPNTGYHTDNGVLVMTPQNSGYPIISKVTFSKDYHTCVRGNFRFDTTGTTGAFGGIVLYNGEGDYRALYGQNDDGKSLDVIVDATRTGYISKTKLSTGVWYAFEIHYFPDGTWRYKFQGQEFLPSGITDPGLLTNDPHLAFFCGGLQMSIDAVEVWTDQPAT